MRRAAAVVLLLTLACASAQTRATRSDLEALAKKSGAPAVAVAVVRGDRIVWRDAIGATPDTRFRIGSVSKLLTATLFVRLADEGVVGLDDPVQKYVPEAKANPTLRQLSGQLGGIRHYGPNDYFNTKLYDSVDAALVKFIDDPPIGAPGEKYFYSSYGYNLLGAALGRAAKRDFPSLLREKVLLPMGMRTTGLDGPSTRFMQKGNDGAVVEAPATDLSDRIPSGAYLASANDLARFAIGTMHERKRALMFTSQATADGKPTKVGIGWRVARDAAGRMYVHHGGEATGGRAFILIYPEQRVAVVILANISASGIGEKDALAIAERFL